MTITPDEIAELEALMTGDEPDLDEDPTMADEAKATALLRVLGELERDVSDVESLYEHFEQELRDKLDKLEDRKAERLAPLVTRIGSVVRWLENWHRAQVGETKQGKPTRLTIHLPTGTLKLGREGADVDVVSTDHAIAWAKGNAESMVVQPEQPPRPPERIDGRVLRSFCLTALANLPEGPEPGSTWEPVPGVQVTVKARPFTATPDI